MKRFLTPFRIVFVFVLISILGFSLVPRLNVNLLPSRNSPTIYVSFRLLKASPNVVEQQVTAVLENAFSQLSDIEHIHSKSLYDQGQITLIFEKNADLDFKKFEVSSIIRQVYPKLPKEVSYPNIVPEGAINTKLLPTLVYSINALAPSEEIQRTSEEIIKPKLSLLQGIEDVKITGATPTQITVQYDPQKLLSYGITTHQIQDAIQEHYKTEHLGIYDNAAGQRLFVQTSIPKEGLDNLSEIFIKPHIKVKDLAEVYFEPTPPSSHFRINGLSSIRLSIYAKANDNQIELNTTIKEHIQKIKTELPNGYQLYLEQDSTERLSEELQKIYERTALSIGILLLLLLMVHRSWRALIVLLMSVTVNLALSIIWVYIFGVQIHLYSLAGITISFGMILDNAIVMYDHLRKKGNIRVLLALIGATLTTMGALSLIFLLPEKEQHNLADFAKVVIINLFNSLLIAWLFTPAIYHLLYQRSLETSRKVSRRNVILYKKYKAMIKWLVKYRLAFNIMLLLIFGLPTFLIPYSIKGWTQYNVWMNKEVHKDQILGAKKILGGSLYLFVKNVFEQSHFRENQKSTLTITAKMTFGSTLKDMDNIIKKVEKYLSHIEGIDKFVTNVYSGENAQIVITFLPEYEMGSLPQSLKMEVIKNSIHWGGMGWTVLGQGKAFPPNSKNFSNTQKEPLASFRVKMKGYNYTKLEVYADTLAQKLLHHKRIKDVNTNDRLSFREQSTKELQLQLDRSLLQKWKASDYDVVSLLHNKSQPLHPNAYITYQNSIKPVMVKSQDANSFSTFDLMHSVHQLDPNRSIKFDKIGKLKIENTVSALIKEDRQYVRLVGFEYHGSYKFGNDYLDKKIKEMEAQVMSGFTFEKLEVDQFGQKDKKSYQYLLLLLVVIFMISSILFESLRQPLVIIFTIPISFIGLFLTFGWGGFDFDQGGYAAFVMLGGLVVNASIFIVNDLNQYPSNRISTQHYNNNLIKAVMHKASPILMVTFSTILGLVPMLNKGNGEVFWFALAVGTIGGLVMSLFAVFVCLPVWLYKKKS